MKDEIYKNKFNPVLPFRFNEEVADVFDDMVERSIPFYKEVQKIIVTLSLLYYQQDTLIYDLGCSTGTTLSLLAEAFDNKEYIMKAVGIDYSAPMAEKAREKLSKGKHKNNEIRILHRDISDMEFEGSSVVILNYVLHFIEPQKREQLLNKIYNCLFPNSILIVSDKILQSNSDTGKTFAEIYCRYKKTNGYTDMEISLKRDALENILIPCTIEKEENLFRSAGFKNIDILFSWLNFTSFVLLKK